jgi:predicted choloylglycine hydrolase
MQEIELTGSYYDMGQQYGRLLEQAGFTPQPASPEKRQFVRECEPVVQEHTPELLDELQGIADAGDWDAELTKAIPLALGYEPGCSVVAVSGDNTVDGIPLFGRNYDFFRSFDDFSELYHTHPEDRLASIGCSDHWIGRHDGINEAGVAIGHTFVPNRGIQPGIMFAVATRAVLDTCRTVSDAVAFLEQIPHARNTNFLIADREGDIAIVEASPEAVTTTYPTDGFGAATNHFVSESMAVYEPTDEDRSDSETRLRQLESWFEKSSTQIEIGEVQRVLADPEEDVCACATDENAEPIETLWSWTAILDDPEAYLARSRPDEHPYELIEL